MTLSRQLVILLLLMIALVLTGAFVIGVRNSQQYLEDQLASHAQDAATSLDSPYPGHFLKRPGIYRIHDGCDVRPGLLPDDPDRKIDGSPVVERKIPLKIDGVLTGSSTN